MAVFAVVVVVVVAAESDVEPILLLDSIEVAACSPIAFDAEETTFELVLEELITFDDSSCWFVMLFVVEEISSTLVSETEPADTEADEDPVSANDAVEELDELLLSTLIADELPDCTAEEDDPAVAVPDVAAAAVAAAADLALASDVVIVSNSVTFVVVLVVVSEVIEDSAEDEADADELDARAADPASAVAPASSLDSPEIVFAVEELPADTLAVPADSTWSLCSLVL